MSRRTYTILLAAIIFMAIYQVFTLGYGSAREIECKAKQNAAEYKAYAEEHLAVVYERRMGNNTDLLHLRIDTTYREIGKGAYKHEVICDRSYSLRSFDGDYADMSDAVAACFISGKEWQKENSSVSIMEYDCQRATTKIGNQSYEAWYTTALPHTRYTSRVIDQNRGLILEARSKSGDYALRVKHIEERIG